LRTEKGVFHTNPDREEALARLDFLAENRNRLGLLLGDAGSGKSLLLDQFAAAQRRRGAAVASANCLGLSAHELLLAVALGWGELPDEGQATHQLWQRVADRLVELRYEHVAALLLLDDVQDASPDLIAAIERLAAADDVGDPCLTIVCAAETEGSFNLGLRLLSLATLRIELAPWDAVDVQEFVSHCAASAGSGAEFDASATLRLQELAGGSPRKVEQLARLALVAGSQRQTAIDAATIDAVYEELSVAR
jgi:type II secretory pathway predicted ATPase ExeA